MPILSSTRPFAILAKPAVKRSLIGVTVALLLYALLGFAILPALIKSELEKLAPEKLQRRLSIGAVEINPFALRATIRDLKLMEPEGETVFASFDAFTLNLSTESAWRLAPVVQELRLSRPYVHLVRKDAHHYNIDDLIALVASQPKSDEPARFSVNNIQIEEGRIEFDDKPVHAIQTVTDLKLGVPFVSSLPSQVQIFVEPLLSANVNGTPLLIQGKARPFAEPMDAVVDFNLRELDVVRFYDYLPARPRIKLSGAKLDLQLHASFVQSKDKPPALLLNGDATLKSLRATAADGKPLLALPELKAELRDTNVFGKRIEVARLLVNGLTAELARESDGRLSLEHLLPPTTPAATPAAAAKPGAASAVPQLALGELAIRGASLRYTDANSAHPLQAEVEKLDLSLRKLGVDAGKRSVSIGEILSGNAGLLLRQDKPAGPAAKAAATSTGTSASAAAPAANREAPWAVKVEHIDIRNWSARLEDRSHDAPTTTVIAPLALSLQNFSTTDTTPSPLALQASINKTGQLALNGKIGLSPLHADLAIKAKEVDLLPLQPYIADRINLRLTRAALTADGQLQLDLPAGGALAGAYKGSATLGNLATVDKLNGNDFLRWKSLYAGGVDLRLQPFALTVDQVALADFFARIIIDPNGRINLQDVLRDDGDDHRSLTDAAARTPAVRTATAAPASKASAVAPAKTPPVTIRKLTLQGGRVRFTDNFIKPNYSATLADFGGVVTQLSSTPGSSAGVDLRGAVNSAPLAVTGRINPLQGNLFLDLKANVRGMELAPLSAYSGRYVGYGIKKGKLSFEVAYHVEDRKLTAENRLILDQLTFGDPVESPSATKLPVRFALALLSDRNGVVDLNLPIGGSLDDPQFSVGGLIVRVIVNAITKAVTQPFALLGSLFGGGEELSSLDLAPGSTAIPPAVETKLQKLAKALADRPALKLDIAGRVDPETDRAGLKRIHIERKVRALKLRDLQARGESPAPGSLVISAGEYPDLLTRAYRDEKFPKPRNLVGLPKSLPVEEMEKLMIANTEISDDELIALGNQRAQAAKNWLQKNGQIAEDRIFLLAPKVTAPDGKAEGSGVDFSLK
jgi:hypothetical protein